ncbi:MAG: hypothetical protein J7642_04925 [Cyanobacteria bacterium SBC]|nr:hypothetical protein [Cyanobacteria bacterium SBC]
MAQRLKRMPSIIGKLKRFPEMQLSRMQDIGGCRVVVEKKSDMDILQKAPQSKKSILKKTYDYINNPKNSGYRGIHLIYQIENSREPGIRLIEVQLRTYVQHSWATAVEICGTFLNQQLKAEQGDNKWLYFFKLVSFLLADSENQLPSKISRLDLDNIRHEVVNLEKQLNVVTKLRSFSASIYMLGQITDEDLPLRKDVKERLKGFTKNDYILLEQTVTSMTNTKINITPYKKGESRKANQHYLDLEFENRNNPNIDVVLIKVGDMNSLKLSYPNYFADSTFFCQILQNLID